MADNSGGLLGGLGNLLNPDPGALYTGLLSDPATKQALANRQLQAMAGAYGELAMPKPYRVPLGSVLGAGAAAAGNVMDTTMKSRLEAMQALQAQYQANLLGQNVDFMKRAMDPNDPLHKLAFPDLAGTPTPPIATPGPTGEPVQSGTGQPVQMGTGDTSNAQAILSGPLGDKVRYWASYHDVPPEVLASLVHVESSGNPKAVSPAGAQGLTQLMPATAKDLGVTDPFDIDQSLSGGAKYLRQGLDKYNGDLTQALRYYQGGPDERKWGKTNAAYPGVVLAGVPVTQTAAAPTPLIPAPPDGGAAAAPGPQAAAVPPVAAPAPPGRQAAAGPITDAEREAWIQSREKGGQDTIQDFVAKARGLPVPPSPPSPPQIAALPPASGGGAPPVLPPGAGGTAPAVPPVAGLPVAGPPAAPALPGYLQPTPRSAQPAMPLVTPPGPGVATPPVAAAPAPGVIQPMTPQQVQQTIAASQFWTLAGRPEYGKALLESPAFKAAQELAAKAAAAPYTLSTVRSGTALQIGPDGKPHVVYQQPTSVTTYNPASGRPEYAYMTPGVNGGQPTFQFTGVPSGPSETEKASGAASGRLQGPTPGNPVPVLPGQGPFNPGGPDPAAVLPVTHSDAPGGISVTTKIPAITNQPPQDPTTYAALAESRAKTSSGIAEAGRVAAQAEVQLHAMADTLKIMQSGWGASEKAEVARILTAAGIPLPASLDDPAAVQQLVHGTYRQTLAALKAANSKFTGGEFSTMSKTSYNPDLEPAANHQMIAEDIAKLRQVEYLADDWGRAQTTVAQNGARWVDPDQFTTAWLRENKIQPMTTQAHKDVGPFKGEPNFKPLLIHNPADPSAVTYKLDRASGKYIAIDGSGRIAQ